MKTYLKVSVPKIKINVISKHSIIVLYVLAISTISFGQKFESAYGGKLNPGETIYAITNRTEVDQSKPMKFENNVKDFARLTYLEVTYIQPDSLLVVRLDSLELLNRISNIGGDWLLFVHGDSKTFEQAVMRSMDIEYLHKVNVLLFSWPTKDNELNGIKNFKNSKKNAKASINHFAELIQFMYTFKNTNPSFKEDARLSIFFHSLGNSLLENTTLNKINNQDKIPIFDNMILNSAAVNQLNHKYWVEKLKMQERVYITSNKSDFNLKGVRIFTKDGKQLGEKVKQPIADNAYYINFSNSVGFRFPTGTTHTFFIGEIPDLNINIRNLYYNLFHGNEIDFTDTEMFERRKDGIGYDIEKSKNN
jgi:esterase/lipase superfamily enzyme